MENSKIEQCLKLVYACAEQGQAECLHAVQPQVTHLASVLEALADLQKREGDHGAK